MGFIKSFFGGNQESSTTGGFELSGDAGHFLQQARAKWKARDFDTARLMFQKCAYSVTANGSDQEKALLKEEQTRFAKDDPLYQSIIRQVQALVAATPGLLQTALYDQIPHDREEVQRALYFGHELGDIRREKKGRSYAIYPVA